MIGPSTAVPNSNTESVSGGFGSTRSCNPPSLNSDKIPGRLGYKSSNAIGYSSLIL
ncbi:MAG: hypothetical protein N2043_02230 [Ignavibacterium sp.]|nr:hypothetical protein [Ignavibacterium sp.]